VLAHPRAERQQWQASDERIAELAAAGLAGVEVFHPDQPQSRRAPLLAACRELGLVPTGGSDDHGSLTGYRIGAETTPEDSYLRVIAKASGNEPLRRN